MKYIKEIIPVPVEAAKITFRLAIELGIDNRLPSDVSAALHGDSPFEHALLVRPVEIEGAANERLIFMINRPWSGAVLYPQRSFVAPAEHPHLLWYREIRAWLTREYPPAKRPAVTRHEACLLVDCMNGILRNLYVGGEEAIQAAEKSVEDGLDAKWDIDARDFLGRLVKMTAADRHSLLDSVECYWQYHSEVEDPIALFFNVQENPE